MGSASAELDWTRAGMARSPVRFLAAFECSVLSLLKRSFLGECREMGSGMGKGSIHCPQIHDCLDAIFLTQSFSIRHCCIVFVLSVLNLQVLVGYSTWSC